MDRYQSEACQATNTSLPSRKMNVLAQVSQGRKDFVPEGYVGAKGTQAGLTTQQADAEGQEEVKIFLPGQEGLGS